MAMFIALGAGAPIGTGIYNAGGLFAVGWATMLIPILSVLLIVRISDVATHPGQNSGFLKIARKVWLPGIGAAFSSVGYGAILAFGSLLFARLGWEPVWLAFAAYVGGLIAARAFLGHLPDRFGDARTALLFVCVEASGLLIIWLVAFPAIAALGAALTGFGYALVCPFVALHLKAEDLLLVFTRPFWIWRSERAAPDLGWLQNHLVWCLPFQLLPL